MSYPCMITSPSSNNMIWASQWDYGTYHIGDQRSLMWACTSAQSHQCLRCSHTWSMNVDVGSDKQVAQRATIAHLSPIWQGQISFQKVQTHPSFNACSCYMKVSKGSNQKQQRKSGNTIFPIIRSIGVFLRRSRAANSVVGGPIWPKFELIHNIMHVLVTSKFEKDRININRDYVMTSIFLTLKGS